jgi:hypothetical protein
VLNSGRILVHFAKKNSSFNIYIYQIFFRLLTFSFIDAIIVILGINILNFHYMKGDEYYEKD